MKQNNTFKRVAAGALAAISVAGYTVPANVGGFLNNTSVLIADAAEAAKTNKVQIAAGNTHLEEAFTSLTATIVEDGKVSTETYESKRELRDFFKAGGASEIAVQGTQVEIKSSVPLTINLGDATAVAITSAYLGYSDGKFYKTGEGANKYLKSSYVPKYNNTDYQLYINQNKSSTSPFTGKTITEKGVYTSDGNKATKPEDAKFFLSEGGYWYSVYAVTTDQPDTLVKVETDYFEKVSDADAIFTLFTSDATKANFADFLYDLDETQVKAVAENSIVKSVTEEGNATITVAPPVYSHDGRDDTIHTYKFNVPKAANNTAEGNKKNVKISAAKTSFTISNEGSENLRTTWTTASKWPDSTPDIVEMKALTEENVYVISSGSDNYGKTASTALTSETFTAHVANVENKAFQNENIKLAATKNFGAYIWSGDSNDGVSYVTAHYDTNPNSVTAGLYVIDINAPYTTAEGATPKIALTSLPESIDYSFSENEDVLYATGSGYTEAELAKLTAKYTKDNKPTTVDFGAALPNGTEVTPEIAVIPDLLKANSEGKYWTATLTRNKGTDTEATVTAFSKTDALVAVDATSPATNWTTIATELVKKDDNNKTYKVFSSENKLAGAGNYELAVTVYVDENGSTVPKTVKYAWSVNTKDALTAGNITVIAEVVSATTTDDKPLTEDNGTTTNKLTLKASPYGVLQIRANEKFIDGSTSIGLTASASYKNNAGVDVPVTVTVAGFTRQNKLNDKQDLIVKFTDPEFGANEQVITVPFIISNNAIATATYIGEDTGNEVAYNAHTANPTIRLSMDTLDKLEDKIFDTYYVDGIKEEDVQFEYSEGLNKLISVRELTWREEGLPNKVGNYTVFLNYDGEPFAAVNVEIAEHTMYFVPSEDALNVTFGDKLTLKTDYTATDIKGNAVKADMPEVEFEIYKPAYDEDGNIMRDEDGNPLIANALGKTTNRRSIFYVASTNPPATFYTYEKGNGKKNNLDVKTGSPINEKKPTKDLYRAEKGEVNGLVDYDTTRELYNAGEYVVKMKGTVNKNSGYVVEDQVFLLTVNQIGIDNKSFVIYPATLTKNQTATKTVGSANTDDAKIEVVKKYADLGLTLEVTRGLRQNNKISDNDISVAPTTACARNFKNTVETQWHIIKATTQDSMTGLVFKDEETQLKKGGTIVVRAERPKDSVLLAGTNATIEKWGLLYDNTGKLAAPKYNNVTEYKNLNFTYGNKEASKHGGDTAFENAFSALQIGNGFTQTSARSNSDTVTGASTEMPIDTSIGVWYRPYVLLSDGTIYYGDVKYVNITDEATYYLNLKMGDQGLLASKPATEAIDNKEAKKLCNITSKKITDMNEKTQFRKKVQSGYNADDDSFYMYGSYTIAKDNKVVSSDAVEQFGVIADTDGIFAAPTTAKPYGEDSQKNSVKDALKLRTDDVYAVGKADKANPVYDTDEYGLKIQRTSDRSRVTGVWTRAYVDLGDGVVVYTDPVYIASTSDYYTTRAADRQEPNNDNLGLSIKSIQEAARPNQSNWIITANNSTLQLGTIRGIGSLTSIKKVGVVVDNTGSLLTKDPVAKTYSLKKIDGVDAADSRLILGAGYDQGAFNNKAPGTEPENDVKFMLPYKYDADGDEIPFVAREFVTLNIFGKDVTIYGKPVTNIGDGRSHGELGKAYAPAENAPD